MVAFDDSGELTQSVDFPFDEVDERLSPTVYDAADHPNRRDRGELMALTAMLDWIVQRTPKNNKGIEIRATIVAWIFLPHLRNLSLTEIAAMVGRDKQSLGRWVDDFKRKYPAIHAAHCRNRKH